MSRVLLDASEDYGAVLQQLAGFSLDELSWDDGKLNPPVIERYHMAFMVWETCYGMSNFEIIHKNYYVKNLLNRGNINIRIIL